LKIVQRINILKGYSQCISGAKEEFQKSCVSAGRANADIAGIGV